MTNCIYIAGLGEAFSEQDIVHCVTRFKNELDFNDPDPANKYEIKQEQIQYGGDEKYLTSRLSITRKKGQGEDVIYRFYDFDFKPVLLEEYKKASIFYKSLLLFWVIVRKIPLAVWRLFAKSGTGYFMVRMRIQALYAIVLLGILGLSGLLLLPAAVTFIVEKMQVIHLNNLKFFNEHTTLLRMTEWLKNIFHVVLSVSALLIALVPVSKTFITSLATEFVCVSNYLETGSRKQAIIGQLNTL